MRTFHPILGSSSPGGIVVDLIRKEHMFEHTVVRVVDDVRVPQIQEQMEVDSIIPLMRVSEGVEERLVKELMDFAVQQIHYDHVSARVVELFVFLIEVLPKPSGTFHRSASV